MVFSFVSIYRQNGIDRTRLFERLAKLGLAIGTALLTLAGFLYFTYRLVPRRLVGYYGLLDFALLALLRIVLQTVESVVAARSDRHKHRVLIAGAGRVGTAIALRAAEQLNGVRIVGFLDDDPDKVDLDVGGVRVMGPLDHLEDVIRSRRVDEVVFALPLRAHQRLMRMVLALERLPVEVSVVPGYIDLAVFRAKSDEILGFPLIRLRASAIEGRQRLLKRLFDLILGSLLLLVCLPLLPLFALAIRLDSPGPVLIKQQRVGENCGLFGMWKLRTMVQNADEMLDDVVQVTEGQQIIHKRPDDPRITRVGRCLRRWSLDELPQLINVVKGEMSLVGPRPELPWLVERYEGWQRKRFAVPPGITGWWQVSGRSERMMHLHVEDDLYYIQNYSIWLDLRILWRTIWVVLSGKGAY
jgi:exopolysaccharide biosynthesis polyprenyl glycosylphosphotransferase